MNARLLPAIALTLALAACGEEQRPASTPTPVRRPPPVRITPHGPPPAARVQSAPGLEGVIGVGQADLARQLSLIHI